MSEKETKPLPSNEWTSGAEMLANRLKKNLKNLSRWLKKENIDCYRLYDADLPEYALAIDVYQGEKCWVHVQEYQAPKSVDEAKALLRAREALAVVLAVLEIPEQQLFFKVRKQQKGSAQYEKLAAKKQFFTVQESGLKFRVNFADYLDTGLFLDHRITRKMLLDQAQGKRFLNLFAYTGSGTVYAAAGGATATTTIDMSRTYLEWAQENMELNGFSGPAHNYVQDNCIDWLRRAAKSNLRFDLIFLDPPSFSTSKRMEGTFDVQRDQVELLRNTTALLAPNGVLIFSNNLRSFKLDKEALAGLSLEDISRKTLPKDFERNPKIHQCWRIGRD